MPFGHGQRSRGRGQRLVGYNAIEVSMCEGAGWRGGCGSIGGGYHLSNRLVAGGRGSSPWPLARRLPFVMSGGGGGLAREVQVSRLLKQPPHEERIVLILTGGRPRLISSIRSTRENGHAIGGVLLFNQAHIIDSAEQRHRGQLRHQRPASKFK